MTATHASLKQPILNLSFSATTSTIRSFADLKNKNLVLYFYPKDNTPGCTQESKDFSELYPRFQALNTEIIGVSRDSLASHEKFTCKYSFPFPLIADVDSSLSEYFNVIKMKTLFGKKGFGIQRSTFLIDSQGILQAEWRNVKVTNHAATVLQAVTKLNPSAAPLD